MKMRPKSAKFCSRFL